MVFLFSSGKRRDQSMKNLFLIITVFCILLIISCKAVDDVPYLQPTGTITDIDGNKYATIKIGNQWWMKENLKVTKFRNGVEIHHAQDPIDWTKQNSAYCLYENNGNAPGYLYNFYTIEDVNTIAPYGWHIPTDDEWKQLEMYLGMNPSEVEKVNFRGADEGDKLKIAEPNAWTEYKTVKCNNESGFTALAGSCRLYDGLFGVPGLSATGFWWTSSIHKGEPWYRYLDYKKSNIFRYYGPKNYGFSIRCVKN